MSTYLFFFVTFCRTIFFLRVHFELDCVIGYSDHTLEFINPTAATAIGAKVYEKHFTLKKDLPGPDHRMSLEPNELKNGTKATAITLTPIEVHLADSSCSFSFFIFFANGL